MTAINKSPFVSIITPCFNAENSISETIESVINQTYTNWELIIIDDCSNDKSLDIIQNYAKKDDRIRYFKTDSPSGSPSIPRNIGLDNANGDYIFLSDQDDIWHPERIALMSKALETHPIVYAPFTMIDENEHEITTNQKYPHITGNLFRDLITQPYFGCCMAFRRSLLNVALPFPKGTITHDNWIGLLAEILGAKIHILETPLLYYRIHSNNVSHRINSNPLLFKIYYRIKQLLQLYNRKYHSNTAKLIQI